MKNLKIFLIALTLFAVTGCANPKIDGSSEEAFRESLQNVMKSVPEDQKEEFTEALSVVMMSNIDIGAIFSGDGELEGERMTVTTRQALNGKTAEEIIAMAEQIRSEHERTEKKAKAERTQEERRQALQEIEELRVKKAKSESDRLRLMQFEIQRSRFYKQRQSYGPAKPIIELTVRNATGVPVSRAFFTGTLQSPGRSTPWLREDFNYSIPGGLEPGEETTWTLAPNMFSDWGKVEPPSDAVLTVETIGLETPEGSIEKSFDEDDAERLQTLTRQFGER